MALIGVQNKQNKFYFKVQKHSLKCPILEKANLNL